MRSRNREETRYDWRRHWIAPDDADGVAVRGLFPADLHAMSGMAERSKARTLKAMEDVRVLLLRGESGAGKSVALAQEAERLCDVGKPIELADLADGLRDVIALLEEKGDQPRHSRRLLQQGTAPGEGRVAGDRRRAEGRELLRSATTEREAPR